MTAPIVAMPRTDLYPSAAMRPADHLAPASIAIASQARCFGAQIYKDAYPSLACLFADGGYAGQKLQTAIAHLDRLAIDIITRSDARRFVVLPRRRVVERTVASLNQCRRLARDWQASIASAQTWLLIASIRRITRRIARLELSVGH